VVAHPGNHDKMFQNNKEVLIPLPKKAKLKIKWAHFLGRPAGASPQRLSLFFPKMGKK